MAFKIRVAFILMVMVAATTPMYAPPNWQTTHYFYSDYFVTQIGLHQAACDNNSYDWGDDGTNASYQRLEVLNCNTLNESTYCYVKSGGSWVSIMCP